MRRANLFFTTFTVALTAVVLLTSCSQKAKTDKDTLVVALSATPNSLDPRLATDANGMRIGGLLFNSLVKIGPDLSVVGDAAESWEFKDNTYTFKLHKGLTFSNGRPLTGEDVVFTFDEFRSAKNAFHTGFESIENVKTETQDGQLIVKIKMKSFLANFLTSGLVIAKLLPKKEAIAAGRDFAKNPVGTGSFQFTKQNANEIWLTANKTHPYAAPASSKLVFKVIRDDFTRYQKTLKGEIDIVQSEMPLSKVSEFEKRPEKFSAYKFPGLSMTYILVNLEDPALKKLKARQAIAKAIDRDEIIKFKLEGLATAATSILTPNNPFFNADLQNLPLEIGKAKKLVDALGLSNKGLTLKTSNSQAAIENGKVIANQLSKIGLKVKLQSYEWGTFYGDVKKGNFQLATMRWVGTIDPDIYRVAFHSSEKPPGRNRGGYNNKVLDLLVEQGLHIEDQPKRIQHYKKVQKIIHDDLAIIPLWYDQQVAIVNKSVKDYYLPKNGDFSSFVGVHKEYNDGQ